MISGKYYTYGLRDPLTKEFGWIGVTSNLPQRLKAHLSQRLTVHNAARVAWIGAIRSRGDLPESLVFAEHSTKKEAEAHEEWLTRAMFHGGVSLCNIMQGRRHAPSTKAMFSAARRGIKRSSTIRKKFSTARKLSPRCAEASRKNGRTRAIKFFRGERIAVGYVEACRMFGLSEYAVRKLSKGTANEIDGVQVKI